MSESTDELQRGRLAQSILASCAAKFGGVGPLSMHLRVSEGDVLNWIAGQRIPPIEVVQKAIEPFLGPVEQ